MNRRDLIVKGGSGLVLATFVGFNLSQDAEAGKGWCRMDPWALFDGQLVEFYGDAYTETNFSTIVPDSAIFTITKPRGTHTFELVEPFPVCEVRVSSTAYSGRINSWQIKFQFMTTNGDNQGRIQTIAHESGVITSKTQLFSGYSGSVTFPV